MFVVRRPSNFKAMKTLAKIAMIVLMSAGAWMLPQKASAQFPGITFQVFYDQLSPYGAWLDDPGYGYIWIPDEAEGFYPYGSNGHWVLTVFGWTWVSDYPWGWAPFHYGRWNYDDYYGWFWVPGNEWGPAWVTWRRCNGYYGWAPLGPGISFQMSFRREFFMPDERWMFVRDRDFDRDDLDRHFVGRRENHDLIRNARNIENKRTDNKRNVTYLIGPDAKEVGKITGHDIKPLPVNEDTKPGRTIVQTGKVQIYRPPVKREDMAGQKPAPGKIATRETIKPVTERSKGDLIRTNSNSDKNIEKKQILNEKKSVPPKYERTDKTNQESKQQHPIETRDQKQNNQPPRQQPPIETRDQKQNNQPPRQQPPIETRDQKQNNKKQQGAPVQKNQVIKQQQKTAPSKGKVSKPKQKVTPAKDDKGETPHRSN
jgi:hypothetical protein